MNIHTKTHETKLFKNGSNQAVRIPKDMAFTETSVRMYREGTRLVIEPIQEKIGLETLLSSWQPLSETEQFPDIVDEPTGSAGAFD